MAPAIFYFASIRCEVSASHSCHLLNPISQGKLFGTSQIGGCLEPRGGLDILEKRKTLFLYRIEPGFFKRPTRSL